MKKHSLTKAQQRLVSRVSSEGALCRESTPDGWRYFLPGGAAIRADLAERLISKGDLIPRNDGLFSDAAQTFGVPA